MIIYGPYTRKDRRKHIIKVFPNGERKTQSYPRYIMEQQLGRSLSSLEEVDHVDDNFANDAISNYQLLTPTQNRQKEMSREHRKAKWKTFNCPLCGKSFERLLREYKNNQLKQNKAGPFCSRICAGKYKA